MQSCATDITEIVANEPGIDTRYAEKQKWLDHLQVNRVRNQNFQPADELVEMKTMKRREEPELQSESCLVDDSLAPENIEIRLTEKQK